MVAHGPSSAVSAHSSGGSHAAPSGSSGGGGGVGSGDGGEFNKVTPAPAKKSGNKMVGIWIGVGIGSVVLIIILIVVWLKWGRHTKFVQKIKTKFSRKAVPHP